MPASTMWLSTTPPILNDGMDESRSASLARSLQPNCALRMNVPPSTSGSDPRQSPLMMPLSAITFRVAATVPSPLLCTTVLIVSKGWPTATVVMP
jgi:hypothetical protein